MSTLVINYKNTVLASATRALLNMQQHFVVIQYGLFCFPQRKEWERDGQKLAMLTALHL